MALGPGSIAFVGINTNGTDWFAFAALEDIAAGQVIYFTDNELPTANSTTFNAGESYISWTAPAGGVTAGTVVNFTSIPGTVPAAVPVSIGTAQMINFAGSTNCGLSGTQDSLYSYTAVSDATVDTPTAFLSFINIGTPVDPIPASLSASQEIAFNNANDSAIYTGSHADKTSFAGYLAEINNTANWTQAAGATDNWSLNTTAFVLDVAPTLTTSSPADDATGVSTSSNIVLTFSETVVKGAGNILIKNVSDNSIVQTIDVASAAVTVSGNIITIDPPADLASNHAFYVEVAAGAIKDTTTNSFAGISGPTSLNFTTAASQTQVVAFASGSLSVSHNEGQTGTTDFTFTVTRTGGTTGDVNFSGAFTSAGTDSADFVGGKPTSFSGTILSGQTSGTVTVHVAGDKLLESDETFSLTLNSATNVNPAITASLGANTAAVGTIVNDDGFLVQTGQTLTTPQTLVDTNTGTVQTGGTLAVTSTGTVAAITWAGGAVTIDNAGTISATSTGTSRGIDTGSNVLADGSSLIFTNETGARFVAATNDAIRVNSDLPHGILEIDNSGAIVSGQLDSGGNITGIVGGQALDFDNIASATSHTTINNFSGGIIGAAAEDAIRPGANATINNHGLIIGKDGQGTATKSDGIDGQSNAGITVHNFTGGSIVGARDGLTGNFPITVINDAGASIIGMQGSGMNMDTTPTSVNQVTNRGTIIGTAAGVNDGDAIDIDGLLALDNFGLVSAVGHATSETNEGLAIGGGTVNNFAGGIIHSDERAITVNDSSLGAAFGAITINNDGTIVGDDGEAIFVAGTFADTLTNKGMIIGSVALGGGDDTVNEFVGGVFSSVLDGGIGTDTLNLLGTGSSTLANVINFENLVVQSGTWTITDSESYAGGVSVTGGVLHVTGSLGSSPLTIGNGAILDGNGTVGNVVIASGGTLAPGNSPGIIHTGNLSLLSGAHFQVEIAGTSAGQFDQVAVTGSVALGGATLDLSELGDFHPTNGTTFVIVDNDGTDAVTGTFAGLSEGGIISAGGSSFKISYHGGTGNDVTLTALDDGPAADTGFHGDFGGDHKADLLLRAADGGVTLQQMNGAQVTTSTSIGKVGNEWHIDSVADFNGNGTGDILWHNDNGAVATWLMNGTQIASNAGLGTIGSEWHINGTADFGGDGKADILWRSDSGSVALWQMNGSQVVSNTNIGAVGNEWHVEALADFGGDNKSDVLWRSDSGAVAMWQMNGSQVVSNTGIGTVGQEWHIVASGDFNGDGKNDILWRADNGTIALWQMNGMQIQANQTIGVVGNEWHVDGTADFNGDGKTDILWRADDGSAAALWTMDGSHILSQQVPAPIATDTAIAVHHYDLV